MPNILLTLLALFTFNTCLAVEKITLYGDDDYAPYSYVEKGQFKGIYVEFLQRVAEKMLPEYQVSLSPLPWKRGLVYLESGQILALFPPYRRDKDRPYISSYSNPLYHETVALFCHDAVMKKPRAQFPDDYLGLTIGINLGFVVNEKLARAAEAGKVKLEEAKGNSSNLQKLATQRVDCYANDRLSVIFSAKPFNGMVGNKALVLREVAALSGEDAYIGFSRKHPAPYKADFLAKLNTAIDDVKRTGLMEKLVANYKL